MQSIFAGLRGWLNRNTLLVAIVVIIMGLLYPQFVKSYYRSLMTEVIIFAIFAMSLDLLLGYTGLPSFGHAAFFGLGAYTAAFIASNNVRAFDLTGNLLVTMPAAIIVASLFALIIGYFAIRTSGIYFLMITLAAAQMLFSVASRWSSVTGGSDGMSGVQNIVVGIGPLSYEFSPFRADFYYLALVLAVIVWFILRQIVNSPFGWTLQGIRENEGRMKALGYNTFQFKLRAFVIAGAFAGVAGLLSAHFFKNATPETLALTTSGEAMIALIIGGSGTLAGSLLGAGVVKMFPLVISSYIERWQTVEGVIFILFVLFAPNGILGVFKQRTQPQIESNNTGGEA
ncbi:MAG: branched-chain amino acid ABC transporter permease [Chloroflexota bacterium]